MHAANECEKYETEKARVACFEAHANRAKAKQIQTETETEKWKVKRKKCSQANGNKQNI